MIAARTASRIGLLAIAVLAFLALSATQASAGRFIATGHDVDDHCGAFGVLADAEQCHYMEAATSYVRGGAPNPALAVLLLDCTGQTEDALDNAFGAGVVPRQRVCPSADAAAFNSLPLSPATHSAIILGSSCEDDNSLNQTEDDPDGCDEAGGSTPDSDLINARQAEIAAYFNAGGGIFVMSGDENGDGDPSTGPDVFYDFVPIGVQGVEVNPPFCLTPVGIAIGFEDQGCPDPALHNGTQDDINCCATHNSFAEPAAGTALEVAERDSANFPETLTAEGVIEGGAFVTPPPQPVEPPPPHVEPGCPHPIDGTIFQGDDSDETIVGTPGNDLLNGGGGNDSIDGVPGDDCINGQDGDDRLVGAEGADQIRGEAGADVVVGGRGDDHIDGGTDADDLAGDDGDDRVTGRGADDRVDGGAGRDRVKGSGGKDRVKGGPGKDRVQGGTGDDRVDGGPGKDLVKGVGGEDRVTGGPGRDRIRAGGGDDRVNAVDGFRDQVKCGLGEDVARVDDKDVVVKDCDEVIVVRATR